MFKFYNNQLPNNESDIFSANYMYQIHSYGTVHDMQKTVTLHVNQLHFSITPWPFKVQTYGIAKTTKHVISNILI